MQFQKKNLSIPLEVTLLTACEPVAILITPKTGVPEDDLVEDVPIKRQDHVALSEQLCPSFSDISSLTA